MKPSILLILPLLLSLPAAARDLRGEVTLRNDQGEPAPVANASIKFKETGDNTLSKTSGEFRIQLPDKPRFQPGQRVTLKVDKAGNCVLHPTDGAVILPADEYELIPVRLLPAGETERSESCIEKLIADIAEKSKEQITPNGKPEDIDFSRYIQEWAVKYGFSAEQAKAEIDQWVAQIQANQDDWYKLGLAAYAEKNFSKAAQLFIDSAESKRDRRQKTEAEAERLRLEEIRDFRKAGESYANNYQFDKALQAYENALAATRREQEPEVWAAVQNGIGIAHKELGIRVAGQAAQQHLADAVGAFRVVLEVYTRETSPQDWAGVQNNLGNALAEQGIRAGGQTGLDLLARAVDAYRAALEVTTRDSLPQDWATTQNNLGEALRNQGSRSEGQTGLDLLAQAVSTYRAALEVRTRDGLPQDWAATQNNLGNALAKQGIRAGGQTGLELLAQAVDAYRAALEVYTHETSPQYWAQIQNNLGAALQTQGSRSDGQVGLDLLTQAVDAYRAALEVYTRDSLPQGWATTQNNLGIALAEQGSRASGQAGLDLLAQVVDAFRAALEVYTREHQPYDWAQTQGNLALAYQALKNWQEAQKIYLTVCEAQPENAQACGNLRWLYHEKLFDYPKTFALSEQWLKTHPDDQDAQMEFAEFHLTTGRFAEARRRLEGFLASTGSASGSPLPSTSSGSGMDDSTRIALMLLDIAATVGQGDQAAVTAKTQALRDSLSKLDLGKIEGGWSFSGTRHFIGQQPVFADYPWLAQAMLKVEEQDWLALPGLLDQ